MKIYTYEHKKDQQINNSIVFNYAFLKREREGQRK